MKTIISQCSKVTSIKGRLGEDTFSYFLKIACIQAILELNISILAATGTVQWQIKRGASTSYCSRTSNSANSVSKENIFLLNKRKANGNLVLKQVENLEEQIWGVHWWIITVHTCEIPFFNGIKCLILQSVCTVLLHSTYTTHKTRSY